MHYFESLFAGTVFLHIAQGITKAEKSRSVCKQVDGFCVVEMPNDQAAGQYGLQFVKLNLMLG